MARLWWMDRENGFWPIIAHVNIAEKLGVDFDVRFDASVGEQCWAIENDLADFPVKLDG